MKKFLLFSIGMVLSLSTGMAVSEALLTTSSEDLLQQLFEDAGLEVTSSNDAKELESLAANETLPFANLYLYMLQNIMNGPQDAALAEVAKITPYSDEQIENIVLKGSTEEIIAQKKAQLAEAQDSATVEEQQAILDQAAADYTEFKESNDFGSSTQAYLDWYYATYVKPTVASQADLQEALTTEAIINEYNYLSDLYEQELAFQEENHQLSYAALSQEMFLNNDLEDSANIDLLYDLGLIHYLLFGETIIYPDRSEGDDVELAAESLPLFELPESKEMPILLSSDMVDPYTCYEDTELMDALEEYASDPPDTGDALPEEGGSRFDYSVGSFEFPWSPSGGSEEDGADDSTEGESETDRDYVDIGNAFEELDSFLSSLEGPKGNWSRSYLCSELFCITVELVNETDDAEVENSNYEETDDCIACHTAYIENRLEETMSRSLVPSKVSMNWFEDATCKEAGNDVQIDLNVYAIKKPIDLDPGDDLEEEAAKEIDELKQQLLSISAFPVPGGGKTTLGKTLGDLECESLLNIRDISGLDSSLEGALAACQQAADTHQDAINETFEAFTFNTYAQSTSDLFGQVSAELYTMLLYFETFQEGLEETYTTEDAPLSDLIKKPYCQ